MHLKSLKVYCDVVALRSFSRAADENRISQSGASQVVHQVEERLGVRLIDRSKRPFVLTPEGQAFYDGCREIVDQYFELERAVRALHEEVAGRVVVASIYSAGLYHMSACRERFLAHHPRADVRLEYQHPDRIYDLVAGDRADLGLVSYPKGSRTIRKIPWLDEPMVLVCAPGHALADRSAVALEELRGYDVVAFITELKIRRELDKALAAARADVRVVMEFDNIDTIKRAIEIDAGISLLPAPTVVHEVARGTLISVPIADRKLVRPLGILRRRGKPLSRTSSRLIDALLEYAADRFPASDSGSGKPLAGRDGAGKGSRAGQCV